MKTETRDEYEKAVNRVVDYINLHLYNAPNLKKLAEVASISEFHFHRIFKTIIGENLGEYVARLRFEDISQRLRMSKLSLDDIALRTGYATKYALSKAFKKHFGISPSVYRKQEHDIVYFAKARKEPVALNPEFRTIDKKQIAYVRIIDAYGSSVSYSNAWRNLMQYANKYELINNETEFIGLAFDDPTITTPENCRFYACVTVDKDVEPYGVVGLSEIKGGLYAVFLLEGAYSQLLDLYYNIYLNWLPASAYKLRNMYAFEKYLNGSKSVPEHELRTEIYIPVKRKKND